MFWAFIVGNILYYMAGIILAFVFQDNRAFCKYICPITVFLKPMSYYSLFRVKCDKDKCISCGKCKRICPMNVDVTDNSRKRENGTECILCMECVRNCPKGALWWTGIWIPQNHRHSPKVYPLSRTQWVFQIKIRQRLKCTLCQGHNGFFKSRSGKDLMPEAIRFWDVQRIPPGS